MKKKLHELTIPEQSIHDILDLLLASDFSLASQPLPNNPESGSANNIDEPEDSSQSSDQDAEPPSEPESDSPKLTYIITGMVIDGDAYGRFVLLDGLKYMILLEPGPKVGPNDALQLSVDVIGSFYFRGDPVFEPYYLYELIGNSQDNVIRGNSFNNLLDGKAGADTLEGGGGNDTYIVDNVADKVIELKNEGDHDKVISTVSYTLSQNVENLELVGSQDSWGEGNRLDNMIKGSWGNNEITGYAGDDSLRGNLGEDTLTGGTGDDVFIFSQRDFAGGADLITDFEVGKDKIVVSNLVGPFHHYTKEDGPLSFSFESGENIDATNTNGALFSYNTKTGKLYFDHDGAGGDDAIHFATLKNAPVITAADLEVKNIYIPPCAVGDDNPYDFFVYN